MAVETRVHGGAPTALGRALKSAASRLLELLQIQKAELSILLTDDRHIRTLNTRYRGQKCSTDVLSFPQFEGKAVLRAVRRRIAADSGIPVAIGDVVISFETARRQAKMLGISLRQRAIALMVHGTVHLLGYDHEESPREAIRMARRERFILRRLGCWNEPAWPITTYLNSNEAKLPNRAGKS